MSAADVACAAIPADQELIAFVYREARLIDEKRFDEWYDLFTEDGLYWMPLTRNQPDGRLHTSLFYEDRLLLKVRISRLGNPNSFSQSEPSWCQHVLQAPSVESRDPAGNLYVTRTPFMYVESQRDRQDVYAAVAWHHVAMQDGHLRIRMKKIELLNRGAALPSIQLFL
jgi:3-phenylpropionate/cinnamic acid dioxygenase small subunit